MQPTALLCLLLATAPVQGSAAGNRPDDPPGAPVFELALELNALARGTEVTIGDLCEITPVGPDALAIGRLRFGPAPVPGFARTVTRTDILQSLVAAGHEAGTFRFKGATETVVQAVVVEVPESALLEAAETVLRAVIDQEGWDVEWQVAGRVRSLQVPAGHLSREVQARVRDGRTSPSSAVVDVRVLVDGQVAKTVPVQFRLVRFQPVLKTVGAVRAGTPLGPHNVEISREPMAQASGLFLTTFEQVQGMIARRNLQPGQLLMLGHAGPPAVIRKGELVTIVLTRGRVKVTARGIANHDAAEGEAVAVTCTHSRAQVTGVAAGGGLVVVPTGP